MAFYLEWFVRLVFQFNSDIGLTVDCKGVLFVYVL